MTARQSTLGMDSLGCFHGQHPKMSPMMSYAMGQSHIEIQQSDAAPWLGEKGNFQVPNRTKPVYFTHFSYVQVWGTAVDFYCVPRQS